MGALLLTVAKAHRIELRTSVDLLTGSMLKVEEASQKCRDLLEGTLVKVNRHSGSSGTWLSGVISSNCLLSSPLKFTSAVKIVSITLHAGQSLPRYLFVALHCGGIQGDVLLAKKAPKGGKAYYSSQEVTFLSPIGLEAQDEFTLYVGLSADEHT